jgi:DNA-binding MarR family transcriptional regulator
MDKTKKTDIDMVIECLGMQNLLYTRTLEVIENVLHKKGFKDVSAAIIFYIYKFGQNSYPMSVNEFHKKSMISSKNLSYGLRRLEETEYIINEQSPGDKRSRLISITNKGKKLFDAINLIMNDILSKKVLNLIIMQNRHDILKLELNSLQQYYLNT